MWLHECGGHCFESIHKPNLSIAQMTHSTNLTFLKKSFNNNSEITHVSQQKNKLNFVLFGRVSLSFPDNFQHVLLRQKFPR